MNNTIEACLFITQISDKINSDGRVFEFEIKGLLRNEHSGTIGEITLRAPKEFLYKIENDWGQPAVAITLKIIPKIRK